MSGKLDFHAALTAAGRAPEIPEAADAYGWLVGDWELDVLHYWATNIASRGIKAERGSGRAGCLDHATACEPYSTTRQAIEHVWNHPSGVGPDH
jgi:hypothetical protein